MAESCENKQKDYFQITFCLSKFQFIDSALVDRRFNRLFAFGGCLKRPIKRWRANYSSVESPFIVSSLTWIVALFVVDPPSIGLEFSSPATLCLDLAISASLEKKSLKRLFAKTADGVDKDGQNMTILILGL